MTLGRVGVRALASVAAFGLLCALGAGAPAAEGPRDASASRFGAPCGQGFPRVPPKRYRFRIAGTTQFRFAPTGGTETYLYKGVMKRMVCRGTKVEYWQTKGTVTQTFKDIRTGKPLECEPTGQPPHHGIGNAPTQTRPLRRFEIDVGFEWSGDEYQTAVINPRNPPNDFAQGTIRCPDPPAGNGATVPAIFEHRSTSSFPRKGVPKRVVKGKVVNAGDIEYNRYWFHWKLTAIR